MPQTDTPRTRRAVLATAVGAAAATAAATLGRPLAASAANGDPLLVGQDNEASAVTQLSGGFSVTGGADDPAISSWSGSRWAIYASSDDGVGVRGATDAGFGGFGVHGHATRLGGVGVMAVHTEHGVGLSVVGKFEVQTRSGRATIAAGRSYVDIDLRAKGGLGDTPAGTPLCFAALRSFRSGVHVAAVRANYPSSGKARIYLNKAVSSTTNVSWFVVN